MRPPIFFIFIDVVLVGREKRKRRRRRRTFDLGGLLVRIRGPVEEVLDDVGLASEGGEVEGVVIEASLLENNTSTTFQHITDEQNRTKLDTPVQERREDLARVFVGGGFVETDGATSVLKERDDALFPVGIAVELEMDHVVEAHMAHAVGPEDAHGLDDVEVVLLAGAGDRALAVDATYLGTVGLPQLVA